MAERREGGRDREERAGGVGELGDELRLRHRLGAGGLAGRAGGGGGGGGAAGAQLALLLRPDLLRYAGLSGVLHALVAIAALTLLMRRNRDHLVGAAIALGLLSAVLLVTTLVSSSSSRASNRGPLLAAGQGCGNDKNCVASDGSLAPEGGLHSSVSLAAARDFRGRPRSVIAASANSSAEAISHPVAWPSLCPRV